MQKQKQYIFKKQLMGSIGLIFCSPCSSQLVSLVDLATVPTAQSGDDGQDDQNVEAK